MRRGAVALVVTLAACGGGGGAPKATPSPTASTATAPPITPEAQRLRDAATKTLAACPCRFRVWVSAFVDREHSYDARLRGVYDPATKSVSYTEERVKAFESRAVGGAVYVKVGGVWTRLDASGLPAPVTSVLAPMVVADPSIFFAFASGIASATRNAASPILYDVEYDMATVVANAGPYAGLLRRLVPGPSVYESVKVATDGTLQQVTLRTSDTDQAKEISVTYEVLALHQRAAPVAAPPGARPVDVATFSS